MLFDSWFATPKGITAIKKELFLDVFAMLKKSVKVFYEYDGIVFHLHSSAITSDSANCIHSSAPALGSIHLPTALCGRITSIRSWMRRSSLVGSFVRTVNTGERSCRIAPPGDTGWRET